MSCGGPHNTDCGEVLDHLYEFLDNEMAEGDCAKLREHFEECSPCLEKYGLEQAIKALIKRSCGCDDTRRICGARCWLGSTASGPGSAAASRRWKWRRRPPSTGRPGC